MHKAQSSEAVILSPVVLGEKLILSDHTLILKKGITTILGSSGAGKTTLLRALSGLIPSVVNPPLSSLSFMPQINTGFPWLSVSHHVGLSDLLRGRPMDIRRIHKLLGQVGLESWTKAYPHELSQGMRQRMILAQILYHDQQYVLLDEPLSALDRPTRNDLYPLLRTHLSGKTVFWVTHDWWDVDALASTVWYLSDSRIQTHDVSILPVHEILAQCIR